MTDSKQVQIIIRTTKEEKNEIMEESKEKGVSMNEFIKEKLFGSSKKDINSDINDSDNDITIDIIDILREQVSIKDEQIKELHHLLYNRDTKLLESPKHWWQFWKS
ncbi:hypothetical protein [Streptococcus mutans]|uniref:Uncharacterized protein n=1 Tax=Streptococcus mutans TaxID=1309 RepID=Q93UP1_STRMG|nr:hypothetical protein [Streptococcus mutans]AAK48412.1 unknown [Streptococcus mutans]ADW54083.1 hypothetical protein [Streptococcus mutans]ADW54089.1 hypothetical protein [Streptococcus mutans]EMC19636.1 hypothetical protein SMU77_00920 [Streptococcus mutans NV1996]NLQ50476.1 hypothetical protein [Streptococcus mutans]